jgi:minor extracellular serine protease Vpr
MRNFSRTLIVAVVLAAIIIVPAAASPSLTTGGSSGGGIFIPYMTGGASAPNTSISAGGQPGNQPQVDSQTALVELKGDPLSTSVTTRPAPGKKIDFNSSAVKSYRAQLAALRNDFKAWLRLNAPNAKITGQFDISLNAISVQLNGESLQTIASAPQVARAEYEGLYYPTADDPDLSIIQAMQAWDQSGGSATAGEGVKVAIVDTGIDFHHPCFNDAGYSAQKQLGDTRFTNNKVIVARVFNNKTPSRNYTPEAIQDHGTHVAGTVACNFDTPAEVSGVTIPYSVSGVAPRALLGNYNVFPGDVTNARSEDILNALEAAYTDGMDVANMSLGGNSHGIQDLLTVAVDNLDEANMVVAVAAGNSGPGFGTVESPGSAARALTAGASTVPHFVGAPVTVGTSTYGVASGDFATVSSDLTAPLAVVTGSTNGLDTACSPLSTDLSGKIALITRGVCTFSTKIRNTQNAGAVAVLVANNVAGDPVAMASDGTPNQPTVPAYMISLSDGQDLATHDTETVTIGANLQYFLTSNVDIMAGFSGQGPTDVDFRVKPDVVAPGVNVLSSIPLSFCGQSATTCWAFFQGTSMATPHLAGSAAVVRQQHPDWTAAEIRSAIVNTADQGVLKDYQTGAQVVDNANIAGAGREDLLAAVNASIALDPVSVSFGAVPAGSGQTHSFTLSLTSLSSSAMTYDLAVGAGDTSVAYSLDQSSVTLDPGAVVTITVQMTAQKGATPGFHQAWLTVSNAGNELVHAAVMTVIK